MRRTLDDRVDRLYALNTEDLKSYFDYPSLASDLLLSLVDLTKSQQ